MLGGAVVGVEMGAGVRLVVGVGVTPPCPPQLASETNNISASSKPSHLEAVWGLVINKKTFSGNLRATTFTAKVIISQAGLNLNVDSTFSQETAKK